MIGQWLARIPRRTLMIGGVMVLVGGYWLWTSAAHPRMQAMWQAATELSQPIPAHENAIVGGLRQNREESIQHARAIAELEAQAEQARTTIERLQTELQQAQTQLALRPQAAPSGLSEAQTRQLIAEQLQYARAASQSLHLRPRRRPRYNAWRVCLSPRPLRPCPTRRRSPSAAGFAFPTAARPRP